MLPSIYLKKKSPCLIFVPRWHKTESILKGLERGSFFIWACFTKCCRCFSSSNSLWDVIPSVPSRPFSIKLRSKLFVHIFEALHWEGAKYCLADFSYKGGGSISGPLRPMFNPARARSAWAPRACARESARAVTGRRNSHRWEGGRLFEPSAGFFYGYSCNSGTESQKIVSKVGN